MKLSWNAVKPNLNLRQVESGGDRSSAGHFDRREYRESQPGCKRDKLQICGQSFHGKYPQEHAEETLLGGGSNLALRGECKPGGQERQHSTSQQRWIVLLRMFSSCRYSTCTKYMKESETVEMLFSNISYLKQFRLNKMGVEVVISDRSLISKFLKG